MAPVLAATIKHAGGFNIKELLSKGLTMGDELHGSFEACSWRSHELDSSPHC